MELSCSLDLNQGPTGYEGGRTPAPSNFNVHKDNELPFKNILEIIGFYRLGGQIVAPFLNQIKL